MTYLYSLIVGRLNRRNYFGAFILRIAGLLITTIPAYVFGFSDEVLWQKIIIWAMWVPLWYFGYSVTLRRFNDMNINKFFSIVMSVIAGLPFVFFGLLFVFLFFMKGSKGRNNYGEEDNSPFIESVFKIQRRLKE